MLSEFERFAEALPDAVLLVDEDGLILGANSEAGRLFDRGRADLIGSSVESLVPEELRRGHAVHRARFADAPHVRPMGMGLELLACKMDGSEFPVEISLAPMTVEGRRLVIAAARDISERKRAELALREVVEGTAAAIGEGFFRSLVQHLATALGVRYACVGRLAGSESVETLAVWAADAHAENFSYPLAGLPCETVVSKTLCVYPAGVAAAFPDDELLAEMAVESYIGAPLFGSAGEPLGLLVVMDDRPMEQTAVGESILRIFAARAAAELERLATATELEQAEERFRTIFEQAPVGVLVVDEQGRPVQTNRALQEMLGYGEDELARMVFADFTHPDDVEPSLELWQELLAGKRDRYELVKRYVRKDGRTIWANLIVTLVRDADGTPLTRFSLIEDITGWKTATDALREANERFQSAASAVHASLYDWNLETDEGTWTEGIATVFGYALEEVDPGFEWWLERVHPDDRERAERVYRESVAAGREYVSEYRFRARDGEYRDVLDRALPVRDVAGRIVRMVGGIVDITDRKRLEEHLRQSQRLEAVGRLAGGIAHDFNNLLTAMTGYAELLAPRLPDAEAAADLEEIRKAADRAAALTAQLLAFSRRQVTRPKVVDLNAIVRDLGAMLWRLIGEDVELVMALEPELGRVEADPGQLEQVIVNLAVNARDAMPEGGQLTIETANVALDSTYVQEHPSVQAGFYVQLSVSDTGLGMDEETRSHIFEPFYTTKEEGKGTGLGLATVHGIVNQSGGHVWVYSEPGHGAMVKVYLPRVETPAEPAEDPNHGGTLTGSETILLVEDDELVRDLIHRVLEQAGYTVLVAGDAGDALELVAREGDAIELLLTDTVMPGMSGRELAELVVRHRADLPVLFMSGYTGEALASRGLLEPEVPLLPKPFTPRALLRKVREVLDR